MADDDPEDQKQVDRAEVDPAELDDRSRRMRGRALRAFGASEVKDSIVKIKAIIGVKEVPASEPLAQAALDKLRNGERPSAQEFAALETVIRLMRPVIPSTDGLFAELPRQEGHDLHTPELTAAWDAFRAKAQPKVGSVGRIDLGKSQIGAGFIVGAGLIATNRHVLGMLTDGSEQLAPGAATITFRHELNCFNKLSDTVPIEAVAAIHPRLDMALLRTADTGREAFEIDVAALAEGDPVATIGYGSDDRGNNPAFLDAVFATRFGVRLASLGEALDESASPWLFHDCSTTQGFSGAPVLSVATGKVAGLHRGGQFVFRNEAITSDEVKAFVQAQGG